MDTQSAIRVSKARSSLYSNIRNYFISKNYLEVETPSLSPDLIPEPTIDNFSSMFSNEFVGSREFYLIPSPEIHIKKLISHGCGSVFEISKCFRNCEQLGEIHNPEFTMLEYYTMGFDENDSIKLTKDFLKAVAIVGCKPCVTSDWLEFTVREAVLKYTGLDLDTLQKPEDLRKAAEGLGLYIPGPEPWDDTFNRIFCTYVETAIPKDRPVLFKDYPAQIDCLAVKNGNYRRRWELYIAGIEVANCYMEETNPSIVKSYYEKEFSRLTTMRSQNGKVIPDCDMEYYRCFENFPACSGVAIGLDRLLMAMLGASDIDDVLLFPIQV